MQPTNIKTKLENFILATSLEDRISVDSPNSNQLERIDAEYYSPKYVKNAEIINKLNSFSLGSIAEIKSGSTPSNRGNGTEGNVSLLKTSNIRNGFIDTNNLFKISEEVEKPILQTRLAGEETLVNIVGATLEVIGRTAPVPKNIPLINITQAMASISLQSGQFKPYYITAFLLSKFGKKQLHRLARPTGQYNINLRELESVKIVHIDLDLQEEIHKLIDQSMTLRDTSRQLYQSAQNELLQYLGISINDLNEKISCISSFEIVAQSERMDAEFFQNKFLTIQNLIKNTSNWVYLKDITKKCERGVQPEYYEDDQIHVITSKHLSEHYLDDNLESTTVDFWENNKSARLLRNDLLLYSTGAYIGRTNFYPIEDRAIGSNHITIIRVKPEVCNPIFLSVFMNSIPGLYQTDMNARGSAQREIYPRDLEDFLVWLPDMEFQNHIANLIIEGYKSINLSKSQINKAIKLVDTRIEGEADAAK